MRRSKAIVQGFSAAVLLAGSASFGCAADPARDIEMHSVAGSTKSHFPDSNCQSCHQPDDRLSSGGDTPGFFTLAGTVRETDGTPHSNATVILYDALFDIETRTPGNEVMRVDADALGMFYTTAPLPEVHAVDTGGHHTGENLFPAVLDNESGAIKHMYFGIDTGTCNMCHHDLYRDMSPRDDVDGDPYHQLP